MIFGYSISFSKWHSCLYILKRFGNYLVIGRIRRVGEAYLLDTTQGLRFVESMIWLEEDDALSGCGIWLKIHIPQMWDLRTQMVTILWTGNERRNRCKAGILRDLVILTEKRWQAYQKSQNSNVLNGVVNVLYVEIHQVLSYPIQSLKTLEYFSVGRFWRCPMDAESVMDDVGV